MRVEELRRVLDLWPQKSEVTAFVELYPGLADGGMPKVSRVLLRVESHVPTSPVPFTIPLPFQGTLDRREQGERGKDEKPWTRRPPRDSGVRSPKRFTDPDVKQ